MVPNDGSFDPERQQACRNIRREPLYSKALRSMSSHSRNVYLVYAWRHLFLPVHLVISGIAELFKEPTFVLKKAWAASFRGCLPSAQLNPDPRNPSAR